MDNLTSGNSNFKIENGILKGGEEILEIGDADVGKGILETLKNNPDFVAQVDAVTGEECTFKRMEDESVKCALWMRKEGMKLGDKVGIFTHNHLATYVPCLATLFNRGVACPSFSGHSVENLKFILELIEPKFVFVDEREAILIDKIMSENNMDIKIVSFGKIPGFTSLDEILSEEKLKEIDEFSCTKPNSPEDECFLIFTSGSSGEPKPVLHLYRSLMSAISLCLKVKNKEFNVALNSSPLGWVVGIFNMIVDLMTFSRKIIIHEKGHEPEEILGFIEKYKVTNLLLGLEMVYKFYITKKCHDYDLSSVKRLTIGGTKLNPKVLNFLKEILPNGSLQVGYGSTELLLVAFKTLMGKDNNATCGFIVPGVHVKVINPRNEEILPPNEIGEICFKTPYMLKEYYKNPEATKKAIDKDGWFHTKDLGYFDEKGYGYIAGRRTNLSLDDEKTAIHWEIERILLLNSSVVEVATISNLENSNPRIFAFVTIVPGSKITEMELSDILQFLSLRELQVTVKILENMPLTYNGKIKLCALRKMTENM